MYTERRPMPFNPDDYTTPGTFIALTTGMRSTLKRWGEMQVELALVLPAYYMEGRDLGERHRVPMFTPASMETIERERLDVSNACVAVMQRARADGYDAGAIVQEIRVAVRPLLEAAIEKFKRQQQPKQPSGLLGWLLG